VVREEGCEDEVGARQRSSRRQLVLQSYYEHQVSNRHLVLLHCFHFVYFCVSGMLVVFAYYQLLYTESQTQKGNVVYMVYEKGESYGSEL
jgi:hypothetical protein